MSSLPYQLYGLALRTRLSLPCVLTRSPVGPDVQLVPGGAARFARARTELARFPQREHWFVHHRLLDGTHYVRWTGLFEFLIAADGRRILYRRLQHATPESFRVYLLGQVLSFSLLGLGIESLHGTAVSVNGEAVVFLGDCGYGKSTLGAALLARGCRMVTDDLVTFGECERGWLVHPGIPRLKLFPGVARRVLGSSRSGRQMNNGTSKLVVPLRDAEAVMRPVPLKALYVLSDPVEDRDSGSCVRIEPRAGRTAFLDVIRSAFNLLVQDRERLANQFVFATRLASSVPVRRLSYRRDFSTLPALCDTVFADLGALDATTLSRRQPTRLRTVLTPDG